MENGKGKGQIVGEVEVNPLYLAGDLS